MRRSSDEPRTNDSLTSTVQRGVELTKIEGVGPGLAFMEEAGVPRPVALRVLGSPENCRHGERRRKR